MKRIKTFEDMDNELPDPAGFDLNFKTDKDNKKEELRKRINDLINEFENKYGTWSRINYKGGW